MDYKKMAAAFAAGGAVLAAGAAYTMKQKNQKQPGVHFSSGGGRHVYLQDSSLSSLAVATYLIRDYNFDGANIHIFDGKQLPGGSCSYGVKGGALLSSDLWLHEKGYDHFWELFRSIPSLNRKGASVKGEIVSFNRMHPIHSMLPILRQQEGAIALGKQERRLLERLVMSKESRLEKVCIQDWLGEDAAFFHTDFWIQCRSLFGLKECSAVRELRALLLERNEQLTHLATMEDWMQLPSHPYDALIAPLISYLKGYGVQFHTGMEIEDVLFSDTYNLRARLLVVREGQQRHTIELNGDDLCVCVLGSVAKEAGFGSLDAPCALPSKKEDLWERLASHRSELNVAGALLHPQDGMQGTVVWKFRKGILLEKLQEKSGNIAGSGGLMCFADSNWGLAINVPAQPYGSDRDTMTIWGSVLYPQELGDHVRKPFFQCSGREILREVLLHLGLEAHLAAIEADCVQAWPVLLPYAQAAKLAENDPVLHSAKLAHTNFAVLSPYARKTACGWLEWEVLAARDAVRMLMEEEADTPARSTLTRSAQAVRFVRRLP